MDVGWYLEFQWRRASQNAAERAQASQGEGFLLCLQLIFNSKKLMGIPDSRVYLAFLRALFFMDELS